VLYRGWLPDGTLFDERQNAANPFRFRLGAGSVIAGWDQGVQGMRAGGVRRLVIPPSLGYGDRPMGAIPPNSVLVFEIRLLSVDQ
jgi:FKBP-type peptidyl-prolyl cis-trans isomerase